MIKSAIFVEGLTERIFVNDFLYHYYSEQNVRVKAMELRGKGSYFQSVDDTRYNNVDSLFYLVQVPGYTKVLPMIVNSAVDMINKRGFSYIIGLRDLMPDKRSQKEAVKLTISKILNGSPVKDRLEVLLAVMETEAWLLYDYSMFKNINSKLNTNYIKNNLKIDLKNDDPETKYDNPTVVLKNIFKLVNLQYGKHEDEIERIVNSLNFENYNNCGEKINSFNLFKRAIDKCTIS